MNQAGTERRIHQVLVTQNTEYHIRRGVCVAVRDRRSGRWLRGHLALNSQVGGGLRFGPGGMIPNAGKPSIGEAVFFHASGRDLVTSALVAIDRPPKHVVEAYHR